MPNEPDYKKACEILDDAVQEASRTLARAHLRISLMMQSAQSSQPPEDEEGIQEEIDAFLDSKKAGPH